MFVSLTKTLWFHRPHLTELLRVFMKMGRYGENEKTGINTLQRLTWSESESDLIKPYRNEKVKKES